MKRKVDQRQDGFSLIELLVAMTIMLLLMGVTITLFSGGLSIRARQSRRSDALVSSQAALNVMSREIANSGFGIYNDSVTRVANNGIILADSNEHRIHIRANVDNSVTYSAGVPGLTSSPGEDITYFLDSASGSIVRYDPNALAGVSTTSVVVNKISDVTFEYFNYSAGSSTVTQTSTPAANTGRVRITVLVRLDPVQGQPNNQTVTFTSDVTLRNSSYMLQQY